MHCSDSARAVEGLGVLLQSTAFSGFLLSLVPKLLLLRSGLGWLQSCIYIFIDGERDSSTIASYMEKIYANVCKNMFFRKEWIIVLIGMVACRLQLKMHSANFSFAVLLFICFLHLMAYASIKWTRWRWFVLVHGCWCMAPVWALSLIFFEELLAFVGSSIYFLVPQNFFEGGGKYWVYFLRPS